MLTRRSFVPLMFAAPTLLRAQAEVNRVVIDPLRVRATLDRRIWGSFLEHLGRAIVQPMPMPDDLAIDVKWRRGILMAMKLTAAFEKVSEGYIAFVEELPGANTHKARR